MQINRKIKLCMACILIGCALYFILDKNTRKISLIPTEEHSKVELYSEIEGYQAWQSQQRMNPASDVEAFIRGVRASSVHAEPPRNMSMRERYDLTRDIEFESHRKNISENLQHSEEFLLGVSKKPGIKTLVEKQLYYELLSVGHGPQLVEPLSTHLFHYTVSDSETGKLFDTRATPSAQKVYLDCVISGFAKGVLGMRMGERRKLYIHPALGFRTMHWTVRPNAVLIFDVELVAD
jgi:peptidylprolyl isomerase